MITISTSREKINRVRLTVSASINCKKTPDWNPLLHKNESSLAIKCVCNYRSEVGILIFFQESNQLQISMALYQCARFFNNPRLLYGRAVRFIANYIASNLSYLDKLDCNNWSYTHVLVCKTDKEKFM